MDAIFGAQADITSPVARWYNVDYLDESMMSILPENATSADEAEALENAQYITRYAAEIIDLDGLMRINPDYPSTPNLPGDHNYDNSKPSFPTDFDASNPADPNEGYLKYQSYMNRYARSVLSMQSTREVRTTNAHMFHKGYDPLDLRITNARLDGGLMINSKGSVGPVSRRSSSSQMFRGAMYSWAFYDGGAARLKEFSYAGKAHNYHTLGHYFQSHVLGVGYIMYSEGQMFGPFGAGMRDQSWDDANVSSPVNGTAADNPNVPWRVNLLTSTSRVREMMILSLSSHIMFARDGDFPSGEAGQPGFRNRAGSAAADLFGEHYPEAFPLGLDDGRDVLYIGALKAKETITNASAEVRKVEGFKIGGTQDQSGFPLWSNRFSYWFDVVSALGKATESAYFAWNRDWDPRLRDKDGRTEAGPVKTKTDPGSLIRPSESDRDAMIQQVEEEFLRILGENLTNPSTGLLAGNKVETGYGAPRPMSQLYPSTNTRAMEYLLNDIRMSFFGTDARNFNADGDGSDDYAESTVN
ncbi:MAG: hypothetical protein HRU15_12945, partial [Planctomycetes bacterium]|nr:hypothetical protein [Planctomycetota bacterium]